MESLDWAMLPKNVIDSVLEKLSAPADYVHFSLACMSWKSVAKEFIRSRRTRLISHPLSLAYTGKEAETWSLCNMRNDKVLDVQLELPNKRFCGFSKGWLITVDENFIVTLIDPSSKVKGRKEDENAVICLPALKPPDPNDILQFHCRDYSVFKATMSADSISNAKACVILVAYGAARQMAFIRLDRDATWTYIKGFIYDVQDVIYFEDKFYAVECLNQLWSFAVSPVTSTQFRPSRDIDHVVGAVIEDEFIKRYLVEF